jgi:cytoskeleton protein RodZ
MDGTEHGATGADPHRRTGATLAAARAARGIELADIARDTRVPLRHLKALETEDHSGLPALPYAIGFVKAYARAVGLDSEAMALQFRAETSKMPHAPVAPSFEARDGRRLPSPGLVTVSIAIVVAIIAGLSAWGAGMFDPAPPAAVAEAPLAVDASLAPADPAMTSDPAALSAPPAAAPAATAGATVVLTAREEVWVRIADRATGVSARIGVMAPGESFTVPADQPGLKLWTGKAGALAITVGGQPIPPLGGPVDSVRNASLTPADLLARLPGAAPAALPTTTPVEPLSSGPRPIATVPRRRPAPPETPVTDSATPPGDAAATTASASPQPPSVSGNQ